VLVAVEFMLARVVADVVEALVVVVDVEATANEELAAMIGPEFEGFGLGAIGVGNTAISKCTCRQKTLRSGFSVLLVILR